MATKTRLAELLLRFEELRQAGQAPTAEELCRDCPELLEPLKRHIELFGPSDSAQPSVTETQSTSQALAGTLKPSPHVPQGDQTLPAPPPLPVAGGSSLDIRPGAELVPGYRLVARLGRGNFGEVWKATAPGGFAVALKIMPLQEKVKATELQALEIIKSIRHPNLVTAFGAWELHGYLIVAMELADRTLGDRSQQARDQGLPGIPPAELLDYFRQAAKGIDYLNQPHHTFAGDRPVSIQHRDIKPQNMLLVGSGVKVADFGLVRLLDRALTTHTGNMTPAYAAPEFLRGHTSNQSDQYCLAVTYCELRGGRLPFEGTLAEVLNGHLTNPPDLSMLPVAEQRAVNKALAKEPGQRWPSCQAFVEALAAAMQTPTIPRRPTRSSRWPVAAAIVIVAGLMVTFLPSLLQNSPQPDPPVGNKTSQAETSAENDSPPGTQTADVPAATESDVVTSHESPSQSANTTTTPSDRVAVNRPTRDDKSPNTANDTPTVAQSTTEEQPQPATETARLEATKGDTAKVEVAKPDEQKTVAVQESPARTSVDTAPSSAPVVIRERPKPAVELTPQLPRVGELCRFVQHRGVVRCVAVSPSGEYALSGGEHGDLWLWDLETGQRAHRFAGHSATVHCVAFSRDGRLAASGSEDKTVRLWDTESKTSRGVFNGHTEAVFAIAFSSDGSKAVSGGQDTNVRVWKTEDRTEQARLNLPSAESVWCLDLSSDDRHVLTASDSKSVRLWNIDRTSEVHRFEDHRDVVWSVAFSPDGARALSGGGVGDGQHDYALRLWDIEKRTLLRQLTGHNGPVVSVAFSGDGRRAVSSSADKTVRLWDVEKGEELHCFDQHTDIVHCVSITRDGRRAVSASEDGTARVWVLPP
jgi:WD40 repeat protein